MTNGFSATIVKERLGSTIMKMASLSGENLKVSLFCTFELGEKKDCYATMQLFSDLLHGPDVNVDCQSKVS